MTVVREFHEVFGLDAPTSPSVPSRATLLFRLKLLEEEIQEVRDEIRSLAFLDHSPDAQIEGMRRLLKELCDLRYVTDGCAVTLGLPIEDAYVEVHRSNMSKLAVCPACGGTTVAAGVAGFSAAWHPPLKCASCAGSGRVVLRREDGKVLKSDSYEPADMEQFVPGIIEGSEA